MTLNIENTQSKAYTDPQGKAFELQNITLIKTSHPGSSPLYKAELVREGTDEKVSVILKKFQNLSQARNNEELSKDPISKFVPTYYGALDQKTGKQCTVEKIPSKADRQEGYLILEDLLEGKENTRVKDFKFFHPRLRLNEKELVAHFHGMRRVQIKKLMFYLTYYLLSFCSLVLDFDRKEVEKRKTKSPSFRKIVSTAWSTKKELKKQFQDLDATELEKTVKSLKSLKEAVRGSRLAFVDASLLFVSHEKGRERKLDVRLIDFNHAFDAQVDNDGFVRTREESAKSLGKIISVAQKILNKKQQAEQTELTAWLKEGPVTA